MGNGAWKTGLGGGGKRPWHVWFLGNSREKCDDEEVGKKRRVNNKIYSKDVAQGRRWSQGQPGVVVTAGPGGVTGRRVRSSSLAEGGNTCALRLCAAWLLCHPGHGRKRVWNGKDVAVSPPLHGEGKILVNGKLESGWFHRERRWVPQETGPGVAERCRK